MLFTSENIKAWQELSNRVGKDRPSVGKRVKITKGKYANQEGIVTWHGINQFASTRYKTDAQLHLRDLCGREGYRVCVKRDDGSKFFVDADKTLVL